MSKNTLSKGINVFAKILTIIIVILLIFGAVGAVAYLLNRPQGLYITYGDMVYGNTLISSSSGGLLVQYDSTVAFTIQSSNGWGVYSVQDCAVKIIPNVDDTHDFEFIVGDSYKSSLYSAETDLSAAFCEDYDGNGITVSSDGMFTINTTALYMSDVLSAVYSDSVTVDGEYNLFDYPYIALSVTSPDGGETLIVPLRFGYIEFDKDVVIL